MEGLIPLVFRAINRKRTRRQYTCLSARRAGGGFSFPSPSTPPHEAAAENRTRAHRKHRSMGGFSPDLDHPERTSQAPPLQRLERDGGSFRLTACVNGG